MATRMWFLGAVLACNLGCERTPRPEATAAAETAPAPEDLAKATLARPDPMQMSYDPATRVLSLYDLPEAAGHWMIYSKGKLGEPVAVTHSFMTDVDLDAVAVFYTTASGQTSPRVTLREIVTVNVVHRGR